MNKERILVSEIRIFKVREATKVPNGTSYEDKFFVIEIYTPSRFGYEVCEGLCSSSNAKNIDDLFKLLKDELRVSDIKGD